MRTRPLTDFTAPKYWPTWFGLAVLRVLSFMPLPMTALLGYTVGYLFYLIGAPRRKIALRNISSCFPELSLSEQKRINRQHFMYAGQMVFAGIINWWSSKKRFNKWVNIYGKEHYDEAIAQGKNIILLAPHFSGLEVAGIYLAQERSMTTMYQYSKNELIDQFILRGRLSSGGLPVERKEPLRKLLKLIRDGHPFYYLPDQDAGRRGVFVPFFHELASTIPMLGKFAKIGKAVVIPCRTQIKPWGRGYEVYLGEPIQDFPVGDDIEDTAKMNRVIEQMIRENPEQYFWAHKRFKTRPLGEDKFYN